MAPNIVSVLLPCYNAMPFLPDALESIMNQTYRNLEIICINGSTDNTGAILDDYAKKDNRIKVIHNSSNLKLIKCLNKGIDLATGEFLARMDADDVSSPDRIEKELGCLLENETVDVLGCGIVLIKEDGKIINKPIIRQHTCHANYFASFFYVPLGHSELIFRTSVLRHNKYLEEEHALHTEDYELWSRLLRKGYHLRNIDTPLQYVRINSRSVSRQFTKIQDNNFVECASRHWFNVFNRKIEPDVMHVIVNRMDVSVQTNALKKGLKEMRWLKNHFSEKYKTQLQKDDKREIYLIYKSHIFDICVQGLKKTKIISKIYIILVLIKNADMFFNIRVWKYIAHKLNYL